MTKSNASIQSVRAPVKDVTLLIADIRAIDLDSAPLRARLSAERLTRMRGFCHADDAKRCMAAGLLLYEAFGKREYTLSPFGKPMLEDGPCFSLSHSGSYALLGVCLAAVGVDIQAREPMDALTLAKRFFHPAEYAAIARSSEPLRAFYGLWTLKESYIKADGRGMSLELNTFALEERGACTSFTQGAPQTPYAFLPLNDLYFGYSAAVCVQGAGQVHVSIRTVDFE